MVEQIDISVVIVIYKKNDLDLSATLVSLKPYIHLFNNITIVNNGPEALLVNESLYFKKKNVTIIEHLANRSLSSIYNDFIKGKSSERFVILDDDTEILDSYISNLVFSRKKFDLGLPIIRSNHDKKIYYPVNRNTSLKDNFEYNHQKGDYSISSGMIISSKLINRLCKEVGNVFDERISLYGVDISLFKRLDKLVINKAVFIQSGTILEHDLSKFSKDSSKFRKKELLIDLILQNNIYGDNFIKISLKNILFFLKGISLLDSVAIKHTFYALIYKKHYRSEYK
ncbi:glycosyltransferase [Klebsiella pneumoniae]